MKMHEERNNSNKQQQYQQNTPAMDLCQYLKRTQYF